MTPALENIEHRFNGDAVEPWESFPEVGFCEPATASPFFVK
jgi:hypothetical protein